MLDWKPEYIALLSRLYRENILKVATAEGYLKANGEIGRAAHVTGRTVERWITGEKRPSAVQGERLVRWAATVEWWEEWEYGLWKQTSLAGKLHELIEESKNHAK